MEKGPISPGSRRIKTIISDRGLSFKNSTHPSRTHHPIPDTDLQVSTTAGLLDFWEGGICQGIDIYATYAEIIGICCE